MVRIEWNEGTLSRLLPRTAADVKSASSSDLAERWAVWRTKWQSIREPILAGLSESAERWAAHTRTLDELAQAEAPPSDLAPDVATAMMAFYHDASTSWTALQTLLALHGVQDAFGAWLGARGLQPKYDHHEGQRRRWLAPGRQQLPWENVLRGALLQAEPDDYAACRALAEPHITDVVDGPKLLGRFPNEEEWVRYWVDEYLKNPKQHRMVVGALLDAELDFDTAARVLLTSVSNQVMLSWKGETFLARFGVEAVPTLLEVAEKMPRKGDHKDLARTLSNIASPEVARAFAHRLSKKPYRTVANHYFARFPELAADALGSVKKGRSARYARELLERVERAAAQSDLAEADEADLPDVLRSPPWLAKKKKRRRRSKPFENPGVLDGPRGFAWNDEERVAAANHYWGRFRYERIMDPVELEAYEAEVKRAADSGVARVSFGESSRCRARVPDAVALRLWNEHAPVFGSMLPLQFLTEHGDDAIEGMGRWANRWLGHVTSAVSWALHAYCPAMAAPVALLLRRRSLAGLGRRWLTRFPEAAIAGLVPAAVGTTGRSRSAAEDGLRLLSAHGQDTRIRERASELGKAVRKAVDAILDWDAIWDCPRKAPKMPPTWRPAELTRPRLASGAALPLSALEHLGAMLKFSKPDPPYAGLEQVRAACDERTLAEMAWDLASSWENGRAAKRDEWMCWSLLHLADDEVVRRTTPALKNPLVVEVLAAIGTSAAIMELATIAGRGRMRESIWGGVGHLAEKKLEEIADGMGISLERLEERLTPTLGVGPDGMTELDYGERRFRVGFDQKLEPYVIGPGGGRLRTLPRARKTDDAERVERAKILWADLREDVHVVALRRITLLERAMVEEHTWSAEDFREAWIDHDLMFHVTRRVVWMALLPDGTSTTFRVAEDRSFADVRDDRLELPGGSLVAVPRPLRWPDDSLPRWRSVFRDYQLLSPIDQLDRTVAPPTGPELEASSIERPLRAGLDWNALRRAMVARGFSGSFRNWSKTVAGDVDADILHVFEDAKHGIADARVRLTLTRDKEPVPAKAIPPDTMLALLEAIHAR